MNVETEALFTHVEADLAVCRAGLDRLDLSSERLAAYGSRLSKHERSEQGWTEVPRVGT